jgi:outer membrane protein assembly factor BamE (lipoprotein component of BamABCDE complex)
MGAIMNNLKSLVNHTLRAIPVGLLALAVVCGVHAQSADRTEQLEKEVRDIKLRLSNLEAAQDKQAASPKPAQPVQSGDGWKEVANWRALKSGMAPGDVRALLGEPARLDGGTFANWYYPSGGRVEFIRDRVHSWSEPR